MNASICISPFHVQRSVLAFLVLFGLFFNVAFCASADKAQQHSRFSRWNIFRKISCDSSQPDSTTSTTATTSGPIQSASTCISTKICTSELKDKCRTSVVTASTESKCPTVTQMALETVTSYSTTITDSQCSSVSTVPVVTSISFAISLHPPAKPCPCKGEKVIFVSSTSTLSQMCTVTKEAETSTIVAFVTQRITSTITQPCKKKPTPPIVCQCTCTKRKSSKAKK